MLDSDVERYQLAIQVQDIANKHRNKIMVVSVPKAVYKRNNDHSVSNGGGGAGAGNQMMYSSLSK